MPDPQARCPCGLPLAFDQCCGRFIEGDAWPTTAEALMRSRYTAFVVGATDWIVETHDPKTRNVDRDAIEHWSRRADWLGLTIVSVDAGGPEDDLGTIVFEAHYFDDVRRVHRERSNFARRDGRWLYVNGTTPAETGPRQVTKVGRNAPCPCGSGRKYKRCCGRGR